MKINRTYGTPITFEELSCGDVFMSMGQAYIKVNNPNDMNNAVNLIDGDICHFGEMLIVYIADYDFTLR